MTPGGAEVRPAADRAWGAGLAVVLVVAGGVIAAKWATFPDLATRSDTQYELIVARQLLHGRGFTTTLMPLGGLEFLQAHRVATGPGPWPSVHKFPLSQVRIALVAAFIGDPVLALRIASLAPYLLLLVLLYAVGAARTGSTVDGALAALGFLAVGSASDLAVSGLGIDADLLLFTTLVWAATRPVPAERAVRVAAGLGALTGALVLHRYSFVLLAPCLVTDRFVRAPAGRRAAAAAALAGGFVLVAGPWLARSWAAYGALFPSYLGDSLVLHRTRFLRFDPWYVFAWPPLRDAVRADPVEFARKAVAMARMLFAEFRRDVVGWWALLPLAAVGWWRSRAAGRAALTAFAVLNLGVHLFLSGTFSYQVYLAPVAYLLAVDGGRAALAAARVPRPGQRAALAALVIAAVGWDAGRIRINARANLRADCTRLLDCYCYRGEFADWLTAHAAPGDVVVGGDRPWDLAALTACKVVPLPPRPADLERLDALGAAPRWLFVPSRMMMWGDGQPLASWMEWYAVLARGSAVLPGWTLAYTFWDESRIYRRTGIVPSADARAAARAALARWLLAEGAELAADEGQIQATYGFDRGAVVLPGGELGVWAYRPEAGLTVFVPPGRPARLHLKVLTPFPEQTLTAWEGGRPLALRRIGPPERWIDVAMDLPPSRQDWRTFALQAARADPLGRAFFLQRARVEAW